MYPFGAFMRTGIGALYFMGGIFVFGRGDQKLAAQRK